jgi:hypothetical protein
MMLWILFTAVGRQNFTEKIAYAAGDLDKMKI